MKHAPEFKAILMNAFSARYLEEETFIPTRSALSDPELNDVVKYCIFSKYMPDLSPMVQDGCVAFLRSRRN